MLAISAATMASCDGGNDVKYVEGAQSVNAYFATTEQLIELDSLATTFNIPVARAEGGPSVVNIKVSDPSGKLIIPDQATFQGDELITNIVVEYNIKDFEYEESYPVQLTIENPNTYGNGDYSFDVMRPAPYKILGQGYYTDGIMSGMFSIDQLTYLVEIQESEITPGLFRVKNPYAYKVFDYTDKADMVSDKPYYMYVHCEEPDKVYVPEFSTNMSWNPAYGVFNFVSFAGYYLSRGNSLDLIAQNGFCGTYDKEKGIITMPDGQNGFLWHGTVGEYATSMYYTNGTGWRLCMPGVIPTDYSATVSYQGRFTDLSEFNYMVVNVELGEDVKEARVAAEATDNINALKDAIINGETDFIEIKESGEVRIPVEESGKYTIMVVTYADGEPQEIATTSVNIELGGSEWETIGEAGILDGWMLSASSQYAPVYEEYTWFFPIQRSVKRPGIYRLIYPYGPSSPMGKWAEVGSYNIEINAEDPTDVYIEPQSTGNGMFSNGIMIIATAGYWYNLKPEYRGTFEDGAFMFPAGTCFFTFDINSSVDDYYASQNKGGFQIMEDEAYTASKSYKAKDTSLKVGTAKQRMKATPYKNYREFPRFAQPQKVEL